MADYFHVDAGVIVTGPRPVPTAWKNVSGFHLLSDPELKTFGWLPQVKVGELDPFDPATQSKDGPVHVVNADNVMSTWTVRAKTVQEQDDFARLADITAILDGMLDLAEIVITHVDTHLVKANILTSDFNLATRQKYTDFKARVDRLR